MSRSTPTAAPSRAREAGGERFDVAVLGAGVVGVATAYALARRGLKIVIIDQAEGPALACSFANGAQLSYVYTEPLASPGLLVKLPGLALGLDPVFRIKPSLDPQMLRWTLSFLANCTDSRFRRATVEGLKLGFESRLALHALLERHPLSFGHRAPGKLHLLHSPDAVAGAARIVELKRRHGAVQEILGADEARAIEPALQGAEALVGAVYSPQEEIGDAHLFSVALTEALRRDYGVATRFGFPIEALAETRDGILARAADGRAIHARSALVAVGADSARFLRPLGLSVPVMAMKGYSFSAPEGPAAPSASITDSSRKLVFCPLSGEIRVAGLAELGNRDKGVDPKRLGQLVASARASLPEAADYAAAAGGWAGLRPMTPSSLPIVRRAGTRLFLNIGHGMLGWTYAMGTAERAAALVAEALQSRTADERIPL